jgi:hypothetical protein
MTKRRPRPIAKLSISGGSSSRPIRRRIEKGPGTLAEKIGQLQKQIGPEFVTLANIVRNVDLNSPDGREIALIIESLNQSCPE